MKLFVIGATGRTGREIVDQALARGHHVTAFVRSPQGIKRKNERLTVIKGNALDENQLVNAMQNHDAVVSTLGPRQVFKPTSMLHDSAVSTTRAMQRSEVKRLVVLSAAAHFPGIPNRILSFILRNHMRDSLRMEEIVQASGLDWRQKSGQSRSGRPLASTNWPAIGPRTGSCWVRSGLRADASARWACRSLGRQLHERQQVRP